MSQGNDAVADFVQQLGIRPAEEDYFAWLAEVGIESPLPPRWTKHSDPTTGYPYYVDHDRQTSSWENPLIPHLRRVVEIGRGYLKDRSETYFEEQKGILWQQHKHELEYWSGPFSDPQGRSYYVNSTDGISSWQDPRVDAQYIFETESGLLTSLQEVLPAPEPPDGEARSMTPSQCAATAESFFRGTGQSWKTMTKLQPPPTASEDEHKSTLERMVAAADWLRAARKDEEEVQRLQIKRKVEERRHRRQRSRRRAAQKAAVAPLGVEALSLSDQPLEGPLSVQHQPAPATPADEAQEVLPASPARGSAPLPPPTASKHHRPPPLDAPGSPSRFGESGVSAKLWGRHAKSRSVQEVLE